MSERLGTGTWDSTVEALVGHGAVSGRLGSRGGLTESGARRREAIVERLQAAAAGHDRFDPRRALLMSMTRPGHLRAATAKSS